jgi:small conductance mechanosensitive channel
VQSIETVQDHSVVGIDLPGAVSGAVQTSGTTGWDLLLALVVVLLAIPIARLAERLTRKALARIPGLSSDLEKDAGRLTKYAVMVIAGSLALSLLGFNIGWLVAIVVVVVVVVVLMVRPLVENGAAGLLLQSRPSFGVGDRIQVSGYIGEVLEVNSRTTALKTPDGTRVHIPNTQVLDSVLVVYTAFKSRRVSIDLSVDPRADLDAVSQAFVDAVSGVEHVLADPAPVVRARSFGNGTIVLQVRFWFGPDTHSDTAVTDEAIRALQRTIDKEGISLPAPQLIVQRQPTDFAHE